MYDPVVNIEASVVLLKRIADRIENPDVAKIGSIWQYIGREKTNEFGEYIEKFTKKNLGGYLKGKSKLFRVTCLCTKYYSIVMGGAFLFCSAVFFMVLCICR